jgi:ATP-dependent RNA helicase RhlB
MEMKEIANIEESANKNLATRTRKPVRNRRRGSKPTVEPTPDTSIQEETLEELWSASQFDVPIDEARSRFHDFDLPDSVMHAIQDLGFTYCTPIQAEILPAALNGRDAFGRAQTGTGKTAAFLITVITRMLRNPIQEKRKSGTPRVLIIAPTRELVLQISEEARQLTRYCDINLVSVFGGMDYKKQKGLLAGKPVDIIVATPGRLLDFSQRRDLSLGPG